ncbi:hypothetical protein NPX13_g3724 [Xylaria arbuscula]|uniref:Uncharacterized protein n=1 Tax=Xylaria arbuscula TaxID=114810 RepID=A0A9W8NGS8_9PEZI|nr:hypothetical protein NPX13_g3724 [Xylaria arbuscula]
MELLNRISSWKEQRPAYSTLPESPTTTPGPSSTHDDGDSSEATGTGTRPSLSRFFADFTLGFADGLTVPFALTAGLSSLGQTNTVIYAGMAEICAGCISMGIGGYLAARPDNTDKHSRVSESEDGDNEKLTPATLLHQNRGVIDYIAPLQLPPDLLQSVMAHIDSSPEITARVIDNQLLARKEPSEEPIRTSPVISGLSVALGYLLGGSFPLFPYFFVDTVTRGLVWSFVICVIALFIFGFTKEYVLHFNSARDKYRSEPRTTRLLRWDLIRPSLSEGAMMVLFGSIAAVAAVLCVRLFDGLVS